MMRRMICALLVLVMSLSVACPALADVIDSGPDTPPASSPKTGDQIMMYVIIMVVALLALVAVVLLSRKAFKK